MLFAVIGFFRPGIDTAPANLQSDWNEHLAQPALHIPVAGVLLKDDGSRSGMMALIDTENRERAEAYLRSSPYYLAGLYDRCEVLEYELEVGRVT